MDVPEHVSDMLSVPHGEFRSGTGTPKRSIDKSISRGGPSLMGVPEPGDEAVRLHCPS